MVEEIFWINGRGPAVCRSHDTSKAAWALGERFVTGEYVTCGELVAQIVGIERFCVAPEHPAYNDGALLLKEVGSVGLQVGQEWTNDR